MAMNVGTSLTPFIESGRNGARHVCAFFNSDEEAYGVLLPLIKEGFARGEKAVHVINPGCCPCHLNRLAAAGIDVTAARESGQLEIRINTETYLQNGCFEQDRMLNLFNELVSSKGERASPLSRIICQMDWASNDELLIADVIEFEARVNDIWARHDDIVICVYDLNRCSGATVMDIVRTHPMVIIGGTLHTNPFYVQPGQFLEELRERRLHREMGVGET
jgi:hypothetical protein